jgi:predicted GNAT superfamily acetyltransferase
MDDGSNNGLNATLNTHNFSIMEHVYVIDCFVKHYGIRATMVKDRTKYKLAFGRVEYQKLKNVVREFILSEMSYKIVYPRNDFSRL